jgi:hypothetical protein
MFVPNTNSPAGSSPDFESGPIIPNSIFPIQGSGVTSRDGAPFDTAWNNAIPALNTITNPATGQLFDVDGHSHIPWFAIELFEFGPPDTLPEGAYAHQFTYVDAEGNGWNITAPFEVTDFDLAITQLKAPKRIALTSKVTNRVSKVTVTVQNASPTAWAITNLDMLAELVALEVESLGDEHCPSPTPQLLPPRKGFPLNLAPRRKMPVVFQVNFDCANDAAPSTRLEDHADYRFTATLNPAALGGGPDASSGNDICPRGPAGNDKGCGARRPDKTLGGDVKTDVVVR